MNFNPIDIVIILFLLLNMFFGYKNGLLNELKKNISIIVSIILTSLIINNLSNQFYFLKNQVDIFFLSSFLLIFILLVLFIGFILDIIIEQIDDYLSQYNFVRTETKMWENHPWGDALYINNSQ